MPLPPSWPKFAAELDQASQAAEVLARFTDAYSWFLPWFIPDSYQTQMHQLADNLVKANSHFPVAWAEKV
jgi:hypothetical protein